MAGLSGDVRDPDRGQDCQRRGCCFLPEEGAGMMEETGNGRGLVTLHRRQEGGRQTRVGAGREKRVIPWQLRGNAHLLLPPCRREHGELCPLLLQRRARGIGWLLDLDHPFSLGQTPESWSRWGLYFNSIQPDGVRSRIQGVGNAPHQAGCG